MPYALPRVARILPLLALTACAISSRPAAAGARAAVIYVDSRASGAGDGTSWQDAYVTLQDALAAAPPGAEIWTAAGDYRPDAGAGQTPGLRASTFRLRPGVMLYGGFAGYETAREQRDPAANPTILNGDLAGDDQPAWLNHGENAHHVVSAAGVDSTAGLDGFTVYGGYAEVSSGWDTAAGGLLIQDAGPTVANCAFRENLSHAGGAMGMFPGSPRVTQCTFDGNYAWTGRGGAAYCDTGSQPVFSDCRFTNNRAWGASSVGDGGALFNASNTAVRLERCVFFGNSSAASGPPYSNGGAVCNLGDGLLVVDCGFYGNDALVAGGVWSGGDAVIVNSVFSGNSSLVGGGLMLFNCGATMVNCDFSRNDASDGGGIALGFNAAANLRNCILWGNTATGAPSDFKAQIHKTDDSAQDDLRYSCVEGLFTPEPGEDPPDPANFPGCTDEDPMFADADGADDATGTPDDDLALRAGSPCVDAAENSTVPPGTLLDFAGAPRFFDDPCAPDRGLGAPPLVDMGALEFSSSTCTGVAEFPGEGPREEFPAALVAAPNPFREGCRIALRLAEPREIRMEILDVTGRRVRTLASGRLAAGAHDVTWDARDERGEEALPGIYFLRLSGAGASGCRKLVLER